MIQEEPLRSRRRDVAFQSRPGQSAEMRGEEAERSMNPERIWFCAVVSGLLAAIIGWTVSEGASQFIHWEVRVRVEQGNRPDQGNRSVAELLMRLRQEAEARKASLFMGIFGAVLGMSLGAAGGLSRRSARAAKLCGLTGFLVGAAVGTAIPLELVPIFYRSAGKPPDPAFPLVVQTTLYATIGVVGGAAFGFALSGSYGAAKGLLAGAMGGILGATTFNLVHTVFYPLEWDLSPMPGTAVSRLLAHLCVAITLIACVVLATDERVPILRRRKTEPKSKHMPLD